MHKPALWQWLLISLIVIVLDLYSKHLVQQAFTLGNQQTITSFFDLVRYHNEGAAFSFLADAGGWQKWFFTAIAIGVSGLLLWWLKQCKREQVLLPVAFCLILSGAIGNVTDRLVYGYVIDFLHFYYQHWHFPAFNVADSAIFVGAVLLIYDAINNKDTSDAEKSQ